MIYRMVVGERLGHGRGKNSNNLGQGWGIVGAWLGQARLGQGWGMLGDRACLGQGCGMAGV